MKHLAFPLAAAVVFVAAGAPATAQHMNAADAPCTNAGSGATQADCLSAASRKAETDLNQNYRLIMAILDVGARRRLQRAEHTWITYREEACSAERELYGNGTGAFPAYLACMEAETRHHVADLKAAYWWRVEKFGD